MCVEPPKRSDLRIYSQARLAVASQVTRGELPAAPGQRGTAAPWRAACRAGCRWAERRPQSGAARRRSDTRWAGHPHPHPLAQRGGSSPGREGGGCSARPACKAEQGCCRGLRGGHRREGGREAPTARDAHDGGPGADSAVRPQAPAALPPPRRHRAPGAGCDWLGTGRRPDSLANERSPRRRRANGQLRFSLRALGRLSLLKARRGGGEGSEVRAASPEVEAGAAVPPILSQPAACTSVLFPRGPVFLGPPRAVLPW